MRKIIIVEYYNFDVGKKRFGSYFLVFFDIKFNGDNNFV